MIVEVLHCDRIGSDRHLGSVTLNLSGILKQINAGGPHEIHTVEQTLPVLSSDGGALCGQDPLKATTLTLSFTPHDGTAPPPSESDDDGSLPPGVAKAMQHKLLADSRETLDSSFNAGGSPAKQPSTPDAKPAQRGGVGLKFKVVALPWSKPWFGCCRLVEGRAYGGARRAPAR